VTAKFGVVRDIRKYFQDRHGAELTLHDGGSVRLNLSCAVQETCVHKKMGDLFDVIEAKLPQEGASGAVM